MTRVPGSRILLKPLQVAILAMGLVGAGLLARGLLQLYSAPNPYRPYFRPAQEFLNAAIALDSIRLRSGAASAAVDWALDAGRRAPDLLRTLAGGLRGGPGARSNGNIVVMFSARGLAPCSSWPLKIFFEGPPDRPVIRDVVLECQSYAGPGQ